MYAWDGRRRTEWRVGLFRKRSKEEGLEGDRLRSSISRPRSFLGGPNLDDPLARHRLETVRKTHFTLNYNYILVYWCQKTMLLRKGTLQHLLHFRLRHLEPSPEWLRVSCGLRVANDRRHLCDDYVVTCAMATSSPARWLRRHLRDGYVVTCAMATSSPARWLRRHLRDDYVVTCAMATSSPARWLRLHLRDDYVVTCAMATSSPAR
ncbi:hypothetical protein EVAR_41554_1 [Eumeta japonica]|uniref:Uncharacterized protein n=1 Tax=Eumeta variegata TaxID=151549 RepID=A0A4C1XYX2_EUMVA|nr:hypothetical protein EVAR_41554_1 [Eumeta japonica]